uniref:SEC7 domain-containing protein n=1 Tax=Caenorhabditis tropicalis TaxID=1561998 RepID=A0A1I7UG39_9PELO
MRIKIMLWETNTNVERLVEQSCIRFFMKKHFQKVYGSKEINEIENSLKKVLRSFKNKKALFDKIFMNDEEEAGKLIDQCLRDFCDKSIRQVNQHSARSLLELAHTFLKIGDIRVTAELIWGSVSMAIKEFIEDTKIEVNDSSHNSKRVFVKSLSRDLANQFGIFERCHSAFYINNISPIYAARALNEANNFIESLKNFELSMEKQQVEEECRKDASTSRRSTAESSSDSRSTIRSKKSVYSITRSSEGTIYVESSITNDCSTTTTSSTSHPMGRIPQQLLPQHHPGINQGHATFIKQEPISQFTPQPQHTLQHPMHSQQQQQQIPPQYPPGVQPHPHQMHPGMRQITAEEFAQMKAREGYIKQELASSSGQPTPVPGTPQPQQMTPQPGPLSQGGTNQMPSDPNQQQQHTPNHANAVQMQHRLSGEFALPPGSSGDGQFTPNQTPQHPGGFQRSDSTASVYSGSQTPLFGPQGAPGAQQQGTSQAGPSGPPPQNQSSDIGEKAIVDQFLNCSDPCESIVSNYPIINNSYFSS